MDELSPLLNEMGSHPIAFLGGFFSGVLRLSLSDDPVKSWLDQRAGIRTDATPAQLGPNTGNGSGPQSITIE
ncbi:MAG: hypothetical protein VKK04_06780 [Synechococcales bacterium]|nr:hypothetical protein [Synechococcales bacterium]